jgi:16S rRNA processing protein RimM
VVGRVVGLGRVVKAHGLRGEISVKALTDLPLELLEGVDVWLVPPPDTLRRAVVESVRPGPKGPILKLFGVDDIAMAASIAGATISAAAEDLPADWEEPPDWTGITVVDEIRGELGLIEDTIITGANDVWVVRGDRFGEVLIPVIDEVVVELDENNRIARVRLLPGLIEE